MGNVLQFPLSNAAFFAAQDEMLRRAGEPYIEEGSYTAWDARAQLMYAQMRREGWATPPPEPPRENADQPNIWF